MHGKFVGIRQEQTTFFRALRLELRPALLLFSLRGIGAR